ncbi:hypothetical protein NJT12_05010 [Flavobacterium sp. AC]|uniref:SGNH hydrolase-type esterase domain-containing protein n=1 Tax=Flavobacterium azizsancarii TaxID=2961580 RepID=A0ABT4W8V4_9FLAO|nr:SGNH/GDSL hydrolase family protein [Flavobacterium azizsancarii]MDA6068977.1 hypothetical protein [Flavobacterium azizsancarii]
MANILTLDDYTPGVSTEIHCFGDSLTAGAGANQTDFYLSYPDHLKNSLYPRTIVNHGIGGQTIEEIACRQGARPIYLTIENNTFLGTSNSLITDISNDFVQAPSTQDRYVTGIICGVPAIITRTVGTTHYVIRGFGGSIRNILPNSIFYPDSAYNAKHSIQVLWLGRNNVPDFSILLQTINNAILYMEKPRRVLVIGVLPALNEPMGTSRYTAITAVNSTLKNTYPNNYIESTPPTTEEMSFIRYSPSEDDIIDINKGVFPGGMRTDSIHLNGFGYNIMANRVAKMIKQYNW